VRDLFLSLLLGLFAQVGAVPVSWFSADFQEGARVYPVVLRVQLDTVAVYKGSHRIASQALAGQTYQAFRIAFETQFRSADTTFHLHSQGLMRVDKGYAPVWQNTLRSGFADVEWTRRRYTENPVRTEFHSLFYGDGSHTFEKDALPEEFLYLRAPQIDARNPHAEFKVLAPVWEIPYSMGAWKAIANYTGTRLRIDGVDCYQVAFVRADGATSEYFISEQGKLVMRFKTFRGTWFSRIQ